MSGGAQVFIQSWTGLVLCSALGLYCATRGRWKMAALEGVLALAQVACLVVGVIAP